MKGLMVEIRRLTPMDAVAFRDITLDCCRTFPEDVGMLAEEWAEENTLAVLAERFHDAWNEPDQFVFGAFAEGRLVGTLGFSRGNRAMSRHHAYIWGVQVEEAYRGMGIARSLLQETVGAAREMEGLEMLRLKVRSTNHRARNLYRSAGFEAVGIEPRVLKLRGTYVHQEWMVYDLIGMP